jgi:hypothetical protein
MDNKRSEEIAANRLKIIAPLIDSTLDKDKLQQLKESSAFRQDYQNEPSADT